MCFIVLTFANRRGFLFSMRIAILADIHGNLPALEAALYHLEGLQVDQVVIAGDVVGLPVTALGLAAAAAVA